MRRYSEKNIESFQNINPKFLDIIPKHSSFRVIKTEGIRSYLFFLEISIIKVWFKIILHDVLSIFVAGFDSRLLLYFTDIKFLISHTMLDQENTTSIYPQQSISIVAATWNLFASVPPINSLVQLSRSASFLPPPDIICMGTQQCERSLFLSICCEAKREWEAMLMEVFSEYTLAATEVMRGLHTAVLVRNKLRSYYSIDGREKLRAGTCGIMGNKGAISIEISLFGQSFQFINCHLAPHQSGNDARNQTISRILQQLLKKDTKCEPIFLGDFNYRIQMSKQDYHNLVKNKKHNTDDEVNYYSFLDRDQLANQQILKRNFLKYFQQGRIDFPPTYKMDIASNQYNRSRVPGWTDRIFTRKRVVGQAGMMRRESYICGYNILGCDHRPVIGRYSKPVPQGSSSFGNDFRKKRSTDNQSGCRLI